MPQHGRANLPQPASHSRRPGRPQGLRQRKLRGRFDQGPPNRACGLAICQSNVRASQHPFYVHDIFSRTFLPPKGAKVPVQWHNAYETATRSSSPARHAARSRPLLPPGCARSSCKADSAQPCQGARRAARGATCPMLTPNMILRTACSGALAARFLSSFVDVFRMLFSALT